MNRITSLSEKVRLRLSYAILILMPLEGIFALAMLLRIPSEEKNVFLLGFSLSRLLTAGGTLVGVLLLAGCVLAFIIKPPLWQRISGWLTAFFSDQGHLFWLTAGLFALFLPAVSFMLLYVSPASRELPTLRYIFERMGWVMAWIEVAIIQVGLLVLINIRGIDRSRPFTTPLRWAILLTIATIIYDIALRIYTFATKNNHLGGLEAYIFLPAIVSIAWGLAHRYAHDRPWFERANHILVVAFIGSVVFTLYWHTAQWMEWANTPDVSYWHLLANSFLNGRLYLVNPSSNFDLTLYHGQWYVPNPPLPALVMMPFVAVFGVDNLNIILFSILSGVLTVVLVFLVLEEASALGMIPTTRSANLWVTAVFAAGTSYWWMSVMGQMWFMSQVMTTLFSTLAIFFALKKLSPWLTGLALGLAIWARPNVFTLWPLLAGITLYLISQKYGAVRWKSFLGWAVQSVIPIGLAGAGLLLYNYLRFNNFLDFGYVTIHGAQTIVDAAQTYGMFNFHFFETNFHVMFLKMPILEFSNGCLAYSPTHEGTSILAMTPAVIYIFRRIKVNWWVAGAWASVLLSMGALLLYHNTGEWMVGYRYFLDFAVPALMLVALGVGSRPSWVFKTLAIASVVINAAGIEWWFGKWPCG